MSFHSLSALWSRPDLPLAAADYLFDAGQRAILFADILRKRGNEYIEHVKAGQPPVLVFDYEVIVDGRDLERPVNYAIVQIIDRRQRDPETDAGATAPQSDRNVERRAALEAKQNDQANGPGKRPIVVIDPRAGHGPGIGGSKLDSQVGVALNAGHPVYFVMFHPDPVPGQTLYDVQQAEVKFLEEVRRRHPDTELPAVIGNCQAGWATALIGADRPDVTGPMVFNGSPLSYWGGVDGANPMRYRGGLYGGIWLTSLWCDLGNGQFDGAWLVNNFEDLNPANTWWSKQYNVWSKVDSEEERYLNFEKWWGGFFKMTREEIHFIVDSLFVGNELEQGRLQLDEDKWINLKNFKDPIVVFASAGDNITPPQQALNWIYKVYGTVDEIKRNGQVIVYILHPKIGHLGIFVGSKIARKEHTAIIGTVDMIEYLAPGLYEMEIDDTSGHNEVRFAERTMENILSLDDGLDDEAAFDSVNAVSRFNDRFYLSFVSPWVRMMMNDSLAEFIRQMHPLRQQRYLLSDGNPFCWPLIFLAPVTKAYRKPIAPENPFLLLERSYSQWIESSLNMYRDFRDMRQEKMFKFLYDNSWMRTLFPPLKKDESEVVPAVNETHLEIEKQLWRELMQKGGFEAAVVRIVLAVAMADNSFDQREFVVAQRIIETNERLRELSPAERKRLVREQAGIIAHDKQEAIATLPMMLANDADRIEAFEIAQSIATADLELHGPEEKMLEAIRRALRL